MGESASSLRLRIFVEVIGNAGLNARRNPLEVLLVLKSAVNVFGAEQEVRRRLDDQVARCVMADIVRGSWIRGRAVDLQIAVANRGSKQLSPVMLISDLARSGGGGYQAAFCIKADISTQAVVIVCSSWKCPFQSPLGTRRCSCRYPKHLRARRRILQRDFLD
jgi:hypothetical protein